MGYNSVDPALEHESNSSNSSTDVDTKALEILTKVPNNPFGPIVGRMKYVFSCKHNNSKGNLYVSSKAACFRRTTILSQWEMASLIIPWNSVTGIDTDCDDQEMIAIRKSKDLTHVLKNFEVDIAVVKNALSSMWKGSSDSGEEDDEVNEDAVHPFYRCISLFSEKSSSDLRKSASKNRGLVITPREGNADIDDFDDNDDDGSWSDLYNSDDARLTETVISEMKLKMTLDEFFHQFLSDDASTSIVSHHEANGDFDVKSSKWEDDDESSSKKRSITFSHPINTKVSMAPSAGAATKTQVLRRYGNQGICIDSEIWTNNVPLADCFYVLERLIVASNEEGGISLTIKFGNIFVKRTMFKGIINSASVKDNTEFHKGFVALIKKTASVSSGSQNQATDASSRKEVVSRDHEALDGGQTLKEPMTISRRTAQVAILFGFLLVLLNLYFAIGLNRANRNMEKLQNLLENSLNTPEFRIQA